MLLEQKIDDDIDIKILGVPPPPTGLCMPFLDRERGRGLFMAGMDGWRNEWMDEKSFTKNDHDIIYYM